MLKEATDRVCALAPLQISSGKTSIITCQPIYAYHLLPNFRNGDNHGQRSVTRQQGSEKAQAAQEAHATGGRLSSPFIDR